VSSAGRPPPERPRAGVRYVVELDAFEGGVARYRGDVHLPDGSWPLSVEVSADGAVARIDGPDPVRALEKTAAALLKAAAKLPRAEGAGPPPRRVVRWRG
jgi:hypothetical protein